MLIPNQESLSKLNQLNQHLKNILKICDDKGIVNALSDEYITQPAIMMHFIIAHQCLKKIQDNNEVEILSLFTKEEINGLNTIRNISSHDYEGLNLAIIEHTIRNFLPILVEKAENYLKVACFNEIIN